MGKDDGLMDLTLDTIGDGRMLEQFGRRLREALRLVQENPRELVATRDGELVFSIQLDVKLIFSQQDGTWEAAGHCGHVKPPKPIAARRPVYARGSSFKVKPEVQEELPTRS